MPDGMLAPLRGVAALPFDIPIVVEATVEIGS
jgi:hypothetical protein